MDLVEMSWLRRIVGRTRRDRICNEVIWKELGQRETLVDRIGKGVFSSLTKTLIFLGL